MIITIFQEWGMFVFCLRLEIVFAACLKFSLMIAFLENGCLREAMKRIKEAGGE
jgi:hypothetical protein